jgi:serine/threonine-protein kinase
VAAFAQDPISDRARSRIGDVLRDKWRLDDLLGVGGMASVYSATHRNGMRAAVKILHGPAAADPAVRARFQREGYLANRVGHPGAVAILDDDEAEDGSVFLVMELLEGVTVEDLRLDAGGKLATGDVLVIADQALDVLASAHDKKIIHRDIKPGNLFMTTTGTLKVLDFGIARLADSAAATVGASTTYSSSMGTVGFMAPEQARGRWESVDARTDLWALGASMFTMLSGRLAHEAATTNEHLLAAMTEPAPPIASHAADVHDAVAAVVDRALAYERNARWPDARTMKAAVRKAYLALTGREITEAPRLVRKPRRSAPPRDCAPPTLPAVSGAVAIGSAAAAARSTEKPKSRRPIALGVLSAFILGTVMFGVYSREKRAVHAATPNMTPTPTETTTTTTTTTTNPNPNSTSTSTARPTTSQSETAPVGVSSGAKREAPALATTVTSPIAPRAVPSAKTHAVQPSESAPTPSSSAGVDIFGRRR